ncbi:MAG: histidine kinase [Rubrivivax sp.]
MSPLPRHGISAQARLAALKASPLLVIAHELKIGVPLCTGVALFLTAVFNDSFAINLAFSLCIGLSIQALIELGRFGLAAWLLHRRRGRGGDDDAALESSWPGWPLMVPWILLSVAVGYLGGSTLAGALTGRQHLQGLLFGSSLRPLAIIATLVLAVSLGTSYLFYVRGRLAAIEVLAEAARRSAAETQLKLLQSQLEPHMLFNTLANLRVLIALDPPQAQAMLDRLIAFLRHTLAATRSERHALATEFDALRDYLALMGVRMGARLQPRFELPSDLRGVPVPPLLLQPLVENAIKHGLEPKVEGGRLEVQARRIGGDRLQLRVRDTGIGLSAAAGSTGTQFGLDQVRQRLAALYGERARFTLQPAADADGGAEAVIELPLEEGMQA